MTKEKKFYTAKYDRVFKTILCNEDNKELFQEFLSRLLFIFSAWIIIFEFSNKILVVFDFSVLGKYTFAKS